MLAIIDLLAAARSQQVHRAPPSRPAAPVHPVGPRRQLESTADVVVGFADLVGFTALGQTLEPKQIDALLRKFEARADGDGDRRVDAPREADR